jgi:nucleotide-binding universal stress UspA family protein
MALKNIGILIDATPEGEARTHYAAALAYRFGARLIGICAVSASRSLPRNDYYVIGAKAIKAMFVSQEAADEDVAAAVRRSFEAISAKHDVNGEFRVVGRGGPDEDLALCSLDSDLVIIGQKDLHQLPGYLSPERLLLASGTPILVVPNGWKSEPMSKKILVGWNGSRQARRAVVDALPLLVASPSVTLLIVDSSKRPSRHGDEPGADIARYLAQHGAHVEVERLPSHGSPIAEIIISHALNYGADLIVIGAYSRARSVQLVFGGVTRTLLKQSPLPVLVSR